MAISSALGGTIGAVPVGSVTAFAGATAPSGWLLCAGQNVSRTQYSGLFLTIGTTYGVGDGSTTFTLPDLRGRVVAGVDNMGGSAASRLTNTVLSASDTLGATGGAQTHTLTSAQSGVPAHGHGASSGNDNTDHAHAYSGPVGAAGYSAGPYLLSTMGALGTGGRNAFHQHSITVNNNTAANASSGHTNTQPTMVMNYIIKAS